MFRLTVLYSVTSRGLSTELIAVAPSTADSSLQPLCSQLLSHDVQSLKTCSKICYKLAQKKFIKKKKKKKCLILQTYPKIDQGMVEHSFAVYLNRTVSHRFPTGASLLSLFFRTHFALSLSTTSLITVSSPWKNIRYKQHIRCPWGICLYSSGHGESQSNASSFYCSLSSF